MSNNIQSNHQKQEDGEQSSNVKMVPCVIGYLEKNEITRDEREKDNAYGRFFRKHNQFFYYCHTAIIHIIAVIYFAFATFVWMKKKDNSTLDWCDGYGFLLLIYVFIYGRLLYKYIFEKCCNQLVRKNLSCLHSFGCKKSGQKGEIVICVLISIAIVIFLAIDTSNSRGRLRGFIGIFAMLAIGFCISKNPTKVNWKTVVWGLIFQFILALISTRWPVGRSIFQCLSDKIVVFLDFAKDGAAFVFSPELVANGVFAFAILPVIIFFSFFVSIMYYLGVMQYVIKKVGWFLSVTLGTTACESLHAATTLFLGLPESFLVIEPYLNKLTTSEIHAIMCSCFSTISGIVVAAYISYGAQPVNLITAMMMSVPAGLCYAKLLYPETQRSSTDFKNIDLKKSCETSFLGAATAGALSAIPLVLGCVANVVAFVSVVAFLNAILTWFGGLVGLTDLTFELILAKIFTPISYIIGVPWEECESVGSLIGLKTVVNELIAYKEFGKIKSLKGFSPRAETIVTHAICGFSNPGALGVCVGSLSTMVNKKNNDVSATVMRAFFGGIAVCFLTASIAGMLVTEELELDKLSLMYDDNSTISIL